MLSETARRTHLNEQVRAVSSGVLETAATTFLLLIAVRHFQAGALAKGVVAGGGSVGLMLTPAVVSIVARFGWRSAKAASALGWCGCAAFLLMAAIPTLPVFVLGGVLAMTSASAAIPLYTQMYHENYPASMRGRLFSRTVILRIGAAALFSEFAGRVLSGRMDQFRGVLLIFAAAFAMAAICLARCPTKPLRSAEGSHPFRALKFARDDAVFRRTLISWMLMGFANLMMNPMRVEYLANPRYGLALSAAEVAFLTGVLPNLARLVLSPIWGWLFDRMNFFALRIALNIGFALGIVAFFVSDSLAGLVAGALIFGVSHAGGDVAWSLWVTKFAPDDRVADYMSVHTFFTGVRGVVAPVLGFQLALMMPLAAIGMLNALLIVVASAMLIPEYKAHLSGKRGAPLVDEAAD